MKYQWCPAVLMVVVMVSSCSSGSSAPSVEEGKHLADKTRRPVAKTYWRLYNAIGTSVSQGGGDGRFTDCEKAKADSMVYVTSNLLTSAKDGKESAENLAALASEKLAKIGWNLRPSRGVHRSATKDGVQVELRPSEINDWSIFLEAKSECVNLGAAADVLEDAYAKGPDAYPRSRAASARVPVGFPDPDSSGR